MRAAHLSAAVLLLTGCPPWSEPDEGPWDPPPSDPNQLDCTTAPHQDRCQRRPDGSPEGENLGGDGTLS